MERNGEAQDVQKLKSGGTKEKTVHIKRKSLIRKISRKTISSRIFRNLLINDRDEKTQNTGVLFFPGTTVRFFLAESCIVSSDQVRGDEISFLLLSE